MKKTKINKGFWDPTTDIKELKVLGKLGEEAGELCSVVNRCIIQGINESEPVTKKPNKEWLEDELADVLAGIEITIKKFNLDKAKILKRKIEKKNYLMEWQKY